MLKNRKKETKGFTLPEILVFVIILAILVSVVVPMFSDYVDSAKVTTVAANLKYAAMSFSVFRATQGKYPPTAAPGQYPEGMQNLLKGMDWTEKTSVGGQWDWDRDAFGVTAAVSIYHPDWSAKRMAEVDAAMDDGNLLTGCFRIRSGGYMYVIEE